MQTNKLYCGKNRVKYAIIILESEDIQMAIKPYQNKILQPFEAWVQQSLPDIYDDSLSYTDLLAKLLYYVNTLAENNTTLSNDVKNAINYINNYFNNLDVQDEINIKYGKILEENRFEIFSFFYLDKFCIL